MFSPSGLARIGHKNNRKNSVLAGICFMLSGFFLVLRVVSKGGSSRSYFFHKIVVVLCCVLYCIVLYCIGMLDHVLLQGTEVFLRCLRFAVGRRSFF